MSCPKVNIQCPPNTSAPNHPDPSTSFNTRFIKLDSLFSNSSTYFVQQPEADENKNDDRHRIDAPLPAAVAAPVLLFGIRLACQKSQLRGRATLASLKAWAGVGRLPLRIVSAIVLATQLRRNITGMRAIASYLYFASSFLPPFIFSWHFSSCWVTRFVRADSSTKFDGRLDLHIWNQVALTRVAFFTLDRSLIVWQRQPVPSSN